MNKRINGIGGIFFKSPDPVKLREWYKTHLGIDSSEYGFVFQQKDETDADAYTVWCPFAEKTNYFGDSGQTFMINFRVPDLLSLLETLKEEGVEVLPKTELTDYGKFGWIVDCDGNRIELLELPA